jgi:purine-binding chemotaxis protein CheW
MAAISNDMIPDATGTVAANDSGQYFTFMLAGEEYGVNILSVVEIRGLEKTTPLPNAPAFVKGVINLRGVIVPVIDLRERFGLATAEHNATTVVIMLQVIVNDSKRIVGVVVDGVSDVYSINQTDIKPKPEMCTTIGQEYIVGLANIKEENAQDKLVILLDANKLLDMSEMQKAINQGE